MITQKYLKEILDYDAETGIFTSKSTRGHNAVSGDVAGSTRPDRYRQIYIDGKPYLSHRLAIMWTTGSFPEKHTDHINADRADNRLCNIRPATVIENTRNAKRSITSSTGFKGVHREHQKYVAAINYGGKKHRIGLFETPEEAHEAYCDEADRRFGEYANHG